MDKRESRAQRMARLEREARLAPDAYARKLLAVAALGYAVLVLGLLLFFVTPLVVLLAVLAGRADASPGLVFLLLPLLVGSVLLRALWFRIGPPDGIALRDDEAPDLRAEVERVRLAVGAPPVAGIVVDGALNAALATVPRAVGLLGHRHVLVLGWPLLQLLDRDEFAAVVAHELGHADRADGGLDGWIHRMRGSLLRLAHDDGAGLSTSYGYVLGRLLQWYAPYLEVLVRARDRELEFQADAAAAHATSPAVAASAVLRLELATQRRQAHLEHALRALARQQSHPPAHPHAVMAGIDARARSAEPGRVLAIAAREQHEHDSHPVLARRLDAMGAAAALRTPGEASLGLLGEAADRIGRLLETQCRDGLRVQWSAWHADAAREDARLAELEARLHLSVDEAIEHARLVAGSRSAGDGVAAFRRVVEAAPDTAVVRLGLAGALSAAGEGMAAVDQYRHAIALDPGALPVAADAVDACLRDPDLDAPQVAAFAALRDELAPHVEAEAMRGGSRGTHAGSEAAGLQFVEHGLATDALLAVQRTLAGHPRVAGAWVVRRSMPLAGLAPHFVVLVDWRGSIASEAAGLARVSAALALPGTRTVCTGSNDRALAAGVRTVAGAPTYRR